jgi:uncharacterized protein (DUF2249 family)
VISHISPNFALKISSAIPWRPRDHGEFELGQGGNDHDGVENHVMNVKNAPLTVDARGLEPPQPLIVILEALAQVTEGVELLARTDRRPMHLYAQLENRGFTGTTEEYPDGSFVTTIRRA